MLAYAGSPDPLEAASEAIVEAAAALGDVSQDYCRVISVLMRDRQNGATGST